MTWFLLWQRLEEVAAEHAEHGLHFAERRVALSYRELSLRVARCAAALAEAGLAIGDNVGLLLPTSAEFYVALLGAQRAGLAPSPFAPPSSAQRLEEELAAISRALRAGACRALIIDDSVARRLGSALDRLDLKILRIEALETCSAPPPRLALDPERHLALVQYTSGSTSHPKGVAITHAQLAAGIRAIERGIALTANDVNGQWLPVHHDMGLIGSLTGLAVGVEQHLWSPMAFVRDPVRWLGHFASRRATIYAGPNFSYAELAARCDDDQAAQLDLSAWRVAFSGAEPVDPQALRRFEARFCRSGLRPGVLMPVYGLAEATLAATFPELGPRWRSLEVGTGELGPGKEVRSDARGRELVSVGRAVEGHQLRIRHEGATLGERMVGEIQLRGPAIMREYFGDEAATGQAFEEGWLRTGDLGFVAEGDLYITGRLKEMMILHGKNYYPHDVEEIVQSLPGYHRGMAVAFADDDEEGEHMVLVAETRLCTAEDFSALAAVSQRAVRAALAIPRLEVVLVKPGAVPRTTSGKRQRLLVKSRLKQDLLRDSVLWSSHHSALPTGAST